MEERQFRAQLGSEGFCRQARNVLYCSSTSVRIVPAIRPNPYGYGVIEGASFWPRVSARVLDLVVHFAIVVLTGILLAILLVVASGGHPNAVLVAKIGHPELAAVVFSLFGAIVYEIISEAIHGSTIGKLALGMVVVRDDGTPCRMKSATIRSFAYLADALSFLASLVTSR